MSEEVRLRILLGEDEEDDVILFRLVLKKAQIEPELIVMDSGEQILQFLKTKENVSKLATEPFQVVIFLDGQLHHEPSMGLLRWIVQNPTTRNIPVFVLTGSLNPAVREEAKALGAWECFEKPFTVEDVKKVQAMISVPQP